MLGYGGGEEKGMGVWEKVRRDVRGVVWRNVWKSVWGECGECKKVCSGVGEL